MEGLTALERLHLFVRRQVVYNLTNLPRIAVYYHDMKASASAKIVNGWRRANSRFVADLIREAQAAGDAAPDVDAMLLTNSFADDLDVLLVSRRRASRARRDRGGVRGLRHQRLAGAAGLAGRLAPGT